MRESRAYSAEPDYEHGQPAQRDVEPLQRELHCSLGGEDGVAQEELFAVEVADEPLLREELREAWGGQSREDRAVFFD